jgi:hypothetical protein
MAFSRDIKPTITQCLTKLCRDVAYARIPFDYKPLAALLRQLRNFNC